MGSRRRFCPGFSKVVSGPGGRQRQVPAHSSVAALGQGQGDLGPRPTSLVLGSPGVTALVWGFTLFVVFFIPGESNTNIRLRVGGGDSGRRLPTGVQPIPDGALVPPVLSSCLRAGA